MPLFSWQCLTASISSFLRAAMNLRPPSATVPIQTSAFNAVAFQSPAMPNARMSLCTQSVHSFPFSPRPLRTAPSRFPNTIHFGSRPPLIRMSVPAHKSLLVRNVISMLSHRIISRARLYEVIRWSGLLRCVPMIRSKTRLWGVISNGSIYFLHSHIFVSHMSDTKSSGGKKKESKMKSSGMAVFEETIVGTLFET